MINNVIMTQFLNISKIYHIKSNHTKFLQQITGHNYGLERLLRFLDFLRCFLSAFPGVFPSSLCAVLSYSSLCLRYFFTFRAFTGSSRSKLLQSALRLPNESRDFTLFARSLLRELISSSSLPTRVEGWRVSAWCSSLAARGSSPPQLSISMIFSNKFFISSVNTSWRVAPPSVVLLTSCPPLLAAPAQHFHDIFD